MSEGKYEAVSVEYETPKEEPKLKKMELNEDNAQTKQTEDESNGATTTAKGRNDLLYSVDEVPPWYLCIILGFQHYLTAFGSTISVPLFLSTYLCMDQDTVGLSELISTIFFISGLCTLLQSTLGTRLPIIQGGTFAFLTPTVTILTLPQWQCPYIDARSDNPTINISSLPEPGSDDHKEMWQSRLREIQGAIMVASIFQVVIGFSGLVGLLLRFIGPLAITPTITLIGLSLFGPAADKASKQWWIALTTMALIAIFSQYMKNIKIPCLTVQRGKGCKRLDLPIFSLFPVLLAMMLSWAICAILTAAGALPEDRTAWGYYARTDINSEVLSKSKWFLFPYPGQWGRPTVSTAAVFGMLAGVLASMIESLGDYYACARLAGAPPPPIHAVNRGIGVEGIGCILAGAWGSGNGTTSYSENIGAIGITKVGSRRVVQVGGIIMVVLGCFGKFGALFVTIPEPVVGGMFMVMFGMITAVGLSNLQYVDLNSSRNIFILGVSIFFGLSFPNWMGSNNVVNTGSEAVDQILSVLLGTSMFVGGFVGFVLDNTIPGTEEERGIKAWRQIATITEDGVSQQASMSVYDLPLIQTTLDSWPITRYLPFCPAFSRKKTDRKKTDGDVENDISSAGEDNPNARQLDEDTHM